MSSVAATPELITRKGHERLSAELARLRGTRPHGDGDALDRRIAELEVTLAHVQIAPPPQLGVAGIGQPIRIRIGGGGSRDCRLVGAAEADPAIGDISVVSPIGGALVGRRAGDVVEVLTPGGVRAVELISVG
ncbi:GreA/GreB family elongation factor [Conexibacter sp. JD483]|uniref:GreA/GreB family elongation factor n=1 Tax=unclassified Conexibacter TaxID=2627773 RepID=UPI00271AAFC0|nr:MULTISPECIES: GreA/GreB family elongation factor [unclassified Conexibacter]MDO8188639.1 GreA/GreB family elongation factor [Conexibacter sp. CPCC 205706]MDO8201525.1 GreA/GreB family elongation factor [Conexibacter sp. CPCC 205762]MDR9370744.1 GreA/GreB family elongation factor [Conexibacter sp. JD483]